MERNAVMLGMDSVQLVSHMEDKSGLLYVWFVPSNGKCIIAVFINPGVASFL